FLDGRVAAQAVNLCPPGHPRFLTVTFHVTGNAITEHLHINRAFRTRTDEAHLAHENVDQLRNFIPTGTPHEPPDTSHARVIFHRPTGTFRFGIRAHRAEFDHLEGASVQPHTLLRVKDRTG